jgi:glycosyltransferase involved in cell wall biosynthesis
VFTTNALPQVTVIHDLIYMQQGLQPEAGGATVRRSLGRLYRRWVVPHAARRASFLVTVSGIMRDELVRGFGVDAGRVLVVPNTADPELFHPYETRLPDVPRLLIVSGTAPHKNLARFLRALAVVERAGVHFEADVVGVDVREGLDLFRTNRVDGLAPRVRFHKGIPQERLLALYRSASCCVIPSLTEGFGIPLLEALAAGVPFAASDIPIFREIAGDSGMFFDPTSVEEMAAAIQWLVVHSTSQVGTTVRRAPAPAARAYSPAAVATAVDALWVRVAEAFVA